MKIFPALVLSLMLLGFLPGTGLTQPTRIPVLLDTDIGSDIDDALALALVVASPELDLVAVTTVGRQAEDRAWLVCRFLTQVGVKKMPVAFGRGTQPDYGLDWQIQYRRHPAAIFNRTLKPVKTPAVALMYAKLKEHPGQLTLVCIGPLTNVAHLLKTHPDAKRLIKRLVLMGGSLKTGYDGKKGPVPEWNIKSDVAAARTVFASGVPMTVVPLDATANVKLTRKHRHELFATHSKLSFQVQNLYELWDKETPILFDPAAVTAAMYDKFFTMKQLRLQVSDKGMTHIVAGKAKASVATSVQADAFAKWFTDRLRAHGKSTLPKAPKNRSKVLPSDGFPMRVHAFEDYETDIEKRWWMCGKLETKDVPPGSRRACRAVLTQDFDARMGDTSTMYRAVIFNPVPGPPMGGKTRLRFRYKLKGTTTLRVQLYSLSKGYHRYLSLHNLPANQWRWATVDMTDMRRPDGSGGPLAANERIDDIQFYVDPRADLLIDDIVLYEAGDKREKRSFPTRLLFTGWFDTGRQGREWPGDFAIVKHSKPRLWRMVRSVPTKADQSPWLRLHLRGDRRLAKKTALFFRYRASKADTVGVALVHKKKVIARQTLRLPLNSWQETTVRFATHSIDPRRHEMYADEIWFVLPTGAELNVDDVLLYTP